MILNPFLEFEPFDNDKFIMYNYFKKNKILINKNLFKNIINFNLNKQIDDLLIKKFIEKNVLIDENDEEIKYFLNLKKNWEKYGWKEAFKYHLATIDYRFEKNLEIANEKMINYSKTEIDNLRNKKYISNKFYNLEIKENFDYIEKNNILTKNKLLTLLSYAFCFFDERKPSWNGEPLLFRATPSGGARHPSEGYLYIKDVDKMEKGWYYINGYDYKLEKIENELLTEEEIINNFSLVQSNTNIEIKAFVILTSVFEKNMYRYREARTFRSIHIDIGHLLALMEDISLKINIKSFIQYGLSEDFIEKKLKLNFLEEGYQSSIIFGN